MLFRVHLRQFVHRAGTPDAGSREIWGLVRVFQFLMPVLGYFAASWAIDYIRDYDHWVAFILLAYLGVNMIRESWESACPVPGYDVKKMFVLAVATSVDALAVGISLAFLSVRIFESSLLIGLVTFCFSLVGGLIGFQLGTVSGVGRNGRAGSSSACWV